jgi:purine-nucleoside phosphorylase
MRTDINTIEAYYFGSKRCFSNKILFIKRKDRLSEYREFLTDIIEFGNVWHGCTGKYLNERITIIATGIGPSMVGDCVYAINKPNAVILYSGTAGGISIKLSIGDYIIADSAICGDGVSLYYGKNFLDSVNGNKEVVLNLKAQFDNLSIKTILGQVFTTSSVVKEVDEDFWQLVDENNIAIEMGAASFYSAAIASNKKAAAYFWITDLPKSNKSFWDNFTNDEICLKHKIYQSVVETDLKLLSQIND